MSTSSRGGMNKGQCQGLAAILELYKQQFRRRHKKSAAESSPFTCRDISIHREVAGVVTFRILASRSVFRLVEIPSLKPCKNRSYCRWSKHGSRGRSGLAIGWGDCVKTGLEVDLHKP